MEFQVTDEDVNRLCMLFRGKLQPPSVARELILDHGGVIQAANYIFMTSPEEVSRSLKKKLEYTKRLQEDAAKFQNMLNSGQEDWQFACAGCNRMWWKRVPANKLVSKCNKCRRKFDAIPKEHQWGWGEFECPEGHRFKGFGIMSRTKSKCYKCSMKTEAVLLYIIPPKKREDYERDGAGPKMHKHNCNGINCYRRQGIYQEEQDQGRVKLPVCIHPKSESPSLPVRIHCASREHISTGSTFVTVLDQGSLDTRCQSPARSLETIFE